MIYQVLLKIVRSKYFVKVKFLYISGFRVPRSLHFMLEHQYFILP